MKNERSTFDKTLVEYKDTPTYILSTIMHYFYIVLTLAVILGVVTIIGVQVAGWIWGDYTVIYWFADLIE